MPSRFSLPAVRQRLLAGLGGAPQSLPLQLAVLLGCHAVLWPALFQGAGLASADYFEPVLFTRALSPAHLAWPLLIWAVVVGSAARQLTWSAIDPRRRTRAFILLVSGLFAWVYSTYDINFYFNQTHVFDRLLLLVLWAITWLHPAFLLPFVAQVLVIAIQLHDPLPEGDWMWPDKRLPIDALILCCGFIFMKAIALRLRVRVQPWLFPFATLCLTGASYFRAGLNKATIGPHWWSWVLENGISNFLVSAHVQANWLGQVSTRAILEWSDALSIADPLLTAFSFCAELGTIGLLIHWRATRVILVALMVMHLGILSTTGIFFWKWIVFDAALLAYIWLLQRDAAGAVDGAPSLALRDRYRALLGAAAVALGPLYARLVPLAWMDTRYLNFSRYIGVTAQGERYTLDPYFFAPYDVLFTQSRFFYVDPIPTLVGTYGASPSYGLARALEAASVDDVLRIRTTQAVRYYQPAMAQTFEDFVRRFTNASIAAGGTPRWLHLLSPPFHFQRTVFENAYAFQAELVRVEIIAHEFFHQDGRLYAMPERRLLSIDLKAPGVVEQASSGPPAGALPVPAGAPSASLPQP